MVAKISVFVVDVGDVVDDALMFLILVNSKQIVGKSVRIKTSISQQQKHFNAFLNGSICRVAVV